MLVSPEHENKIGQSTWFVNIISCVLATILNFLMTRLREKCLNITVELCVHNYVYFSTNNSTLLPLKKEQTSISIF